jgi:hypothetical protein
VQFAGDAGALAGAGQRPLGGHRVGQPFGHLVEAGFQPADLVAAGDGYPSLVVSGRDRGGAVREVSQPAQQPAGGQQPEHRAHRHRREQHQQPDAELRGEVLPDAVAVAGRYRELGRGRYLDVDQAHGRDLGLVRAGRVRPGSGQVHRYDGPQHLGALPVGPLRAGAKVGEDPGRQRPDAGSPDLAARRVPGRVRAADDASLRVREQGHGYRGAAVLGGRRVRDAHPGAVRGGLRLPRRQP